MGLDSFIQRRTGIGLKNLILLLFSVFIGCIIIEVAARLIYDMPKPYALNPRAFVFDSRGFWSGYPGFEGVFDNRIDFSGSRVRITDMGDRWVPCRKDTEKSARRVFLIGDSQTFGWGLSDADTWANKLQCELNDSGEATAIYNLAVPGTQVDQYWERGYRQVADIVVKGDIVILSMTWNDLATFYASEDFVSSVIEKARIENSLSGNKDFKQITNVESSEDVPENSKIKKLKTQITQPATYLNIPTWRYQVYRDYGIFVPSFDNFKIFLDTMIFTSAAFRAALFKMKLLYYRFRDPNAFQKKVNPNSFKNNFSVIAALSEIIGHRGAELWVQLLPSRLFFVDELYVSYSRGGTAFPARDYLGFVATPFCENLNLKCVNRFEVLRTTKRGEHTFLFDGHYNPAGAQIIAKALLKDITSQKNPKRALK
ncbi:MAG: hypothetical protein CBB68_12375 [Rhodospirillaceae bacterium TMED8]|nr:hypothetical protein [Magnetovibrio sp.]OUT48906.1 MAG: hypothetical protein CBB68_12375 [Rhodospirillaceae bacterium TMED8]